MSKGVLGAPARKRWPPCRAVRRPASLPAQLPAGPLCSPATCCTRSACATRSCMCSAGCASSRSSRSARTGALLQKTLAQHGPPRSWPDLRHRSRPRRRGNRYPAPRPAAGEILQHLTYQPRRGPGRSVTSAKTAASSTRPASRASTGWPNPPQQICKPSWPDRPASRFPSTRHASPRPYPHAPHSLLTMDPAAPPHRGMRVSRYGTS